MLCEEDRIETFEYWPFEDGPCSPENMAKAGFIYTGDKSKQEDSVRCFVCFKEFFSWEKDDDPFAEHRQHSVDCEFVKLGQNQANITLEDFLKLVRLSIKKTLEYIDETKTKELTELYQSYGIELDADKIINY